MEGEPPTETELSMNAMGHRRHDTATETGGERADGTAGTGRGGHDGAA